MEFFEEMRLHPMMRDQWLSSRVWSDTIHKRHRFNINPKELIKEIKNRYPFLTINQHNSQNGTGLFHFGIKTKDPCDSSGKGMKCLNRHFFYSCRIGTHPSKDANWLKYECFVFKLIQPKKRTRNTEVEECSSNESDKEQSIKKIKIPASISSPWLSGEYRERKFRARDDEHCLDAIENMREICLKVMRRSYHGRILNYNGKTRNTITPFYHSYIYQQALYIRKTLAFAEECFPDICSLVDCYKKAI